MADGHPSTGREPSTGNRERRPADGRRRTTDRGRSAVVSALVGAAVTVVLAFLPFSSVLGGAVAGYLRGGDAGDGLRVGALSGVIAAVPMVLLFALVGTVLAFVGAAVAVGTVISVGTLGVDAGGAMALVAVLVLVVVLFSMVYLVGLSALGGAVGAYVRDDPELDPAGE